jgi:hypothetical protein
MNRLGSSYDDWKQIDQLAEQAAAREWAYEVEMEWLRSMMRMEHPSMSEDDIEVMAQQHYEDGTYDHIDF